MAYLNGYPVGDWKKWPVGDSTIDDDFIAQGLEIFENLWSETRNFVVGGGTAAYWLQATSYAEQFLRNYADIPKSYFLPYAQWQMKWALRQCLVQAYNAIVITMNRYWNGEITKENFVKYLDSLWVFKMQANSFSYQAWDMDKFGGTIDDLWPRMAARQTPPMTAEQYKIALSNVVYPDGKRLIPVGDYVGDAIESVFDLYKSDVIVPVPWPIPKYTAPVEVVRNPSTNEIITDDVPPDVLVVVPGVEVETGGDVYTAVDPQGVAGSLVVSNSELIEKVKKYALPVGLAVLAIIALN